MAPRHRVDRRTMYKVHHTSQHRLTALLAHHPAWTPMAGTLASLPLAAFLVHLNPVGRARSIPSRQRGTYIYIFTIDSMVRSFLHIHPE
jgi:hypothetical protein